MTPLLTKLVFDLEWWKCLKLYETLEEIENMENMENLERKVREKVSKIMCIIIHSSCAIFSALNRSVETSEALLFVFKDSSNPLSVDWSPREGIIYPTMRIIISLVPTLQKITFQKTDYSAFFYFLKL